MGALSSTALKAIFVTGAIPTETDFANLFDSNPNIVDGNLLVNVDSDLVPVAPPLLATAPPITKKFSYVHTSVDPSCGIKMPQALKGCSGVLFNDSSNTLTIFSLDGDVFSTTDEFDNVIVPPNYMFIFCCIADGFWQIEMFDYYLNAAKLQGATTNIADVSPSDSGTAFPLTTLYNVLVTTHFTIGATLLPEAIKGRVVNLLNLGAYASELIAQSPDTFIDLTGGDIIQVEPGDSLRIVCFTNHKWSVFISKALDVWPSYERYEALISQTGVAAPTVDFSNTDMGTPVWSYVTPGVYRLTLTNAFKGAPLFNVGCNYPGCNMTMQALNDDVAELTVLDDTNAPSDDILEKATIMIKCFKGI